MTLTAHSFRRQYGVQQQKTSYYKSPHAYMYLLLLRSFNCIWFLNLPCLRQVLVVDRLDSPAHLWGPYLKALLGVPVMHLLLAMPYNHEPFMNDNVFFTCALQECLHSHGILWPYRSYVSWCCSSRHTMGQTVWYGKYLATLHCWSFRYTCKGICVT